MVTFQLTGDALWTRMERAVERVRERLERTTAALNRAGIPHAVVGGLAVRSWVAQVDEAAVRNTRDVDLLLRRQDLPAAVQALAEAGFTHRRVAGVDLFLDGPQATARDAVHVIFAGEKVRSEYLAPAPDVTESVQSGEHRVILLPALVRMKLTSFRDKDRMHLRDLLEVGLVDASWCEGLTPELASRLRELIDNPEG